MADYFKIRLKIFLNKLNFQFYRYFISNHNTDPYLFVK